MGRERKSSRQNALWTIGVAIVAGIVFWNNLDLFIPDARQDVRPDSHRTPEVSREYIVDAKSNSAFDPQDRTPSEAPKGEGRDEDQTAQDPTNTEQTIGIQGEGNAMESPANAEEEAPADASEDHVANEGDGDAEEKGEGAESAEEKGEGAGDTSDDVLVVPQTAPKAEAEKRKKPPSTPQFYNTNLNLGPKGTLWLPPFDDSNEPELTPGLGVLLMLAPTKLSRQFKCPRFNLLRHALNTFDLHVNQALKTKYPAILLYENGSYTEEDKQSIRAVVSKNTLIHFKKIDLGPPAGVTLEQCRDWIKAKGKGAIGGKTIGYRRMCRDWSGPFQNIPELEKFEYYMRIDDDSFWDKDITFDPFKRIKAQNLIYAYKKKFHDARGHKALWHVTKLHYGKKPVPPTGFRAYGFMGGPGGVNTYNGQGPYNNFHLSRVDFWKSKEWKAFFQTLESDDAFMKYCIGDANVHAVAMALFMPTSKVAIWPETPVMHNTNDYWLYPPKSWGGPEKQCSEFPDLNIWFQPPPGWEERQKVKEQKKAELKKSAEAPSSKKKKK